MDLANRKLERALIAIISIGFVIWSAAFIYRSSFIAIDGKRYFCLFDDAMISMRYAWNFSHGLGLVWNQGERVQGYTNLLMTLLMSLATLIFDKSAAALFIQILGAGTMLAIAYVGMQIADILVTGADPRRRALVRVLAFFGALAYYPLVYWSLMGMETGLLSLLLLLGTLFAFEYTRSHNLQYLSLVSGCLGLAYLTRNDSILFAISIWAYIFWEIAGSDPQTMRKAARHLSAAIGAYFLFVGGQFLFQYLYYGEMLPNTYTLKLTGMPLSARLGNGIGFITPFLVATASMPVFAAADLIFDFQKRKLLLFSIPLSAIGYQVYVGGDPWSYWRMMAPTIPLVIIMFIGGIHLALDAISRWRFFAADPFHKPVLSGKFFREFLAVTLTLIGLTLANRAFLPEITLSIKPYQAEDNRINVNTAIALGLLTSSDATIGVFWAGTIPYFADRQAIDFLGKSDRYIAQLAPDVSGDIGWNGMTSIPGHNKYDLNYSIKTLQPTYAQDLHWGSQDLTEWGDSHYVMVRYKGISLFLLKDSPFVFWDKVHVR